ncbi:tetrapyrrole biosynthesis, uroporphyrinogen III synthase [Russula brevipes]|nr:tetrapyrrole biosynthesis, uroporphyrinogen III synthase [Russula brevipes]
MTTAPRVLLLRTPTTPPETDRYEAAVARASFRPLSLPVLETALENLERLSRIIRGEDDEGAVDGVIVTSARALPNPPEDVRGTESGTAERLARYIVQDATTEGKLLYLTGDKNRDTLSRVVREGLGEGVLRELRVYATRGVLDFEGSLLRALQGEPMHRMDEDEPWWIVFFAPSAAAHVMPSLRAHFSLAGPESSRARGRGLRHARLAAIGPTTAEYLRDELGLHVDAVADAPTADSLVRALVSREDRE